MGRSLDDYENWLDCVTYHLEKEDLEIPDGADPREAWQAGLSSLEYARALADGDLEFSEEEGDEDELDEYADLL